MTTFFAVKRWALPALLLTMTRYCLPLSPLPAAATTSVAVLPFGASAQVPPPLTLTCQR